MAYYHVDVTSSGLDDGTSWTNAFQTWAQAFTAASTAGDTILIRANSAATFDTGTGSRYLTFSVNHTRQSPLKVIGCLAGTTNEGANVVAADLTDRDSTYLPTFESTTGLVGYNNGAGHIYTRGVNFIGTDWSGNECRDFEFNECIFDSGMSFYNARTGCTFRRCNINLPTSSSQIEPRGAVGEYYFYDCTIDVTSGTTSTYLFDPIATYSHFHMYGCSFLQTTITNFVEPRAANTIKMDLYNCSFATMPATVLATGDTYSNKRVTLHSTTADTAGRTASYIELLEYNDNGTIESETTEVRTGGADDGSTGQFALKVTPYASSGFAGSKYGLETDWLRVWVDGSVSTTLSVYLTNGTQLLKQDEVWMELLLPPSGDDTTKYEHILQPDVLTTYGTTSNVTADTGTPWATLNTYHQKLATTLTPGYAGVAYAKVHVTSIEASPFAIYVDPVIVVS